MPRVSKEITPRIAELLQAGVISITADFFSSGDEVYGRVMQPHPKLGVYPHQSMKLEELEPLLAKVRVPSVVPSKLGEDSSPKTTPVKKGNPVSVSTRHDHEIGSVPKSIKINGVDNILPKGSLCWKDLAHLSDDQLNRRLLSLGKEIGADKAVSRIASAAYGPIAECAGYSTLYEWWTNASHKARFALITTSKQVGKGPTNVSPSDLMSRLGAGQYPFRGTDAPLEENEEEEEEDEEEELERAFNKSLALEYESSDE